MKGFVNEYGGLLYIPLVVLFRVVVFSYLGWFDKVETEEPLFYGHTNEKQITKETCRRLFEDNF